MRLKAEHIMFWVLIALIIGTAIWKLVGSPTDTATLISAVLFFAGSEILLWKTLFSIEKKTAIGFMKMKSQIEKQNLNINNKLDKIQNSLSKRE